MVQVPSGSSTPYTQRPSRPKMETHKDNPIDNMPTNATLLLTAFISFLIFTIVQSIAAYLANSQAMLGDSAAMAVDAFTYGFNLVAERWKNQENEKHGMELKSRFSLEKETQVEAKRRHEHERERDRAQRETNVILEMVPPLISVLTLILVTLWILKTAVDTLLCDVPLSQLPNLTVMLTFSTINLLLDILNVVCFAKANHAFGYNYKYNTLQEDGEEETIGKERAIHHGDMSSISTSEHDKEANLNMCSAYTHVFADTVRSIAVLIAAVLAQSMDSIRPEEADAVAAIVVSGIILLALIPLSLGIKDTLREFCAIRRNTFFERGGYIA